MEEGSPTTDQQSPARFFHNSPPPSLR